MKKFVLTIFVLFVGIINVYADEITLRVSNVTDSSVTLKVRSDEMSYNDVCYVYRSIDNINFDKKIIVNCSDSYVDKELEPETTYYYKASVDDDNYSEVLSVTTEKHVDDMNEDGKGTSTMKIEIILTIFIVLFISFVLLFVSMMLFKRKISK